MTASAPRTARARAREEITAEILRVGRAQLAEVGPSQLSLRAVARELGMVSSAVYRYVRSRDDLLTALLIRAYDELGATVEAADSSVRERRRHTARLTAVAHAIRDWAVAHPYDYALLYGSPVPGYVAPSDTVGPATRVTAVLLGIVVQGYADGARTTDAISVPRALHAGLAGARAFATGLSGETIDDRTVVRALMAWTAIFGTVSFELFGHYDNGVEDPVAYLDAVVARMAADLGLR